MVNRPAREQRPVAKRPGLFTGVVADSATTLWRSDVTVLRYTGALRPGLMRSDAPLLIFLRAGCAVVQWGDRVLNLIGGEAAFVTGGAYRIKSDGPPTLEALILLLDPEFVPRFRERNLEASPAASVDRLERAFRLALIPFLRATFESLPTFLTSEPMPSRKVVEHRLDEIVLAVLEANPDVWPRLCAIVTGGTGLVRFVASQGTRRTSVQELARASRLSLSTFKRHFRAVTGESPAAWLRRRRLERARLLLESSRLSVAEIAFEVGFSSISHFVHTFRQEYGAPPRAFRKAFGAGHEQPDSDED